MLRQVRPDDEFYSCIRAFRILADGTFPSSHSNPEFAAHSFLHSLFAQGTQTLSGPTNSAFGTSVQNRTERKPDLPSGFGMKLTRS